MAACALIASADDEVSFSERARMDAVLESLAELRIFDPHQAVDLFNDRLDALQTDRDAGRAEAFEVVRRCAAGAGAGAVASGLRARRRPMARRTVTTLKLCQKARLQPNPTHPNRTRTWPRRQPLAIANRERANLFPTSSR